MTDHDCESYAEASAYGDVETCRIIAACDRIEHTRQSLMSGQHVTQEQHAEWMRASW